MCLRRVTTRVVEPLRTADHDVVLLLDAVSIFLSRGNPQLVGLGQMTPALAAASWANESVAGGRLSALTPCVVHLMLRDSE